MSSLRRMPPQALTIRRVGLRRFHYVDAGGHRITDQKTLDRIASLAIPPAYREVCISADPSGHLQAVGRDARGRMQYRYHPAWREARDRQKYRRLRQFASALPSLRRRVDRDLSGRLATRRTVLGAAVRLLETTLARVGGDEYARANGSYGLTTLRREHVSIRGSDIHMRFPGKGGREWSVHLRSRRLARVLRQSLKLPGEALLQYRGADGKVQRIGAADVNDYLRSTTGASFTARDLRTWAGTTLVAKTLLKQPKPPGAAAARRAIRSAIAAAAAELGNTPTVCRKAYVDPTLLQNYEAGTLARTVKAAPRRRGLRPEECVVAALPRPRRSP